MKRPFFLLLSTVSLLCVLCLSLVSCGRAPSTTDAVTAEASHRDAPTEALEETQQKLNEPNATELIKAGRIQSKAGDYEKALVQFEKAIEIDPDPWTSCELGWIAFQAGELEKAEKALGKGILGRAPDGKTQKLLSACYYNLGRLYEKSSKRRKAIDAYEKSLVLRENKTVRTHYEKLVKTPNCGFDVCMGPFESDEQMIRQIESIEKQKCIAQKTCRYSHKVVAKFPRVRVFEFRYRDNATLPEGQFDTVLSTYLAPVYKGKTYACYAEKNFIDFQEQGGLKNIKVVERPSPTPSAETELDITWECCTKSQEFPEPVCLDAQRRLIFENDRVGFLTPQQVQQEEGGCLSHSEGFRSPKIALTTRRPSSLVSVWHSSAVLDDNPGELLILRKNGDFIYQGRRNCAPAQDASGKWSTIGPKLLLYAEKLVNHKVSDSRPECVEKQRARMPRFPASQFISYHFQDCSGHDKAPLGCYVYRNYNWYRVDRDPEAFIHVQRLDSI